MKIQIRQETPEDKNKIFEIVEAAFQNAEITDHDEHHLVNRLRKSSSFISELSLVAEYEGRIIGYILFTEIKIESHTLIALAPLAILPEKQRQGIGGKLIMEGHKVASQLGYKGSIVLGHDKYYSKFGYEKASKYRIFAPFEVPDEAFMAIELQEKGLLNIYGVVKYAKEFFEK